MRISLPNSSTTQKKRAPLANCKPGSWLIPIMFAATTHTVSAFEFPPQTGPYVTGVQDMEFTDTHYPSNFPADSQGRRIMFRVWYPACERSNFQLVTSTTTRTTTSTALCGTTDLGRRRRYFEAGEWDAFFGDDEPMELTETFDLTHSYLNAPPLHNSTNDKSFPAIIYTHGYGMWVSDNTALLEEIASQGYTVFSISSPGFASGTLFPNLDSVSADVDYPQVIETVDQASVPNPFLPPFSTDLQVRHDKMKAYVQDKVGGHPAVFPRIVHDMLALADHLDEVSQSDDSDSRIKQLLGHDGLDQLLYMGFSLGGGAAGSAAQQDDRAVGAINMDGGQQSFDLFGTAVHVPYLAFTGNDDVLPFYYNEFFHEPLESMGTSPTVTRARLQGHHLDFTDYKHLDQSLRQGLLGFTHSVDGPGLHAILTSFCLHFIDTYLGEGDGDWSPDQSFDEFPEEVEKLDLSYVAEWAQDKANEIPTDPPATYLAPSQGPITGPTMTPSTPLEEPSSSAFHTTRSSYNALFVAVLGIALHYLLF